MNDPLINSWIIIHEFIYFKGVHQPYRCRENSRLKCCGVLFGRTQCVPTDGTGVLCQSYGLLIGMCYVLSRGLRLLLVIFHPFGVLLAFPSPVRVKKCQWHFDSEAKNKKNMGRGVCSPLRYRKVHWTFLHPLKRGTFFCVFCVFCVFCEIYSFKLATISRCLSLSMPRTHFQLSTINFQLTNNWIQIIVRKKILEIKKTLCNFAIKLQNCIK